MIIPSPIYIGKPCRECQQRKKGYLWLAASAYLEINRLRGLGTYNTAITTCKAFGKLLKKKKSN
jgi:hypothetical protein